MHLAKKIGIWSHLISYSIFSFNNKKYSHHIYHFTKTKCIFKILRYGSLVNNVALSPIFSAVTCMLLQSATQLGEWLGLTIMPLKIKVVHIDLFSIFGENTVLEIKL